MCAPTAEAGRPPDLHLSEGRPPIIRVANFLIPLTKHAALTSEDMKGFLALLLPPHVKKEFDEEMEANFAWNFRDGAEAGRIRFRCNTFRFLGKTGIAMRLIPPSVKSFEELNLPPILETFGRREQGFFLVVGPVGVGKSTTLAAMIESINRERLAHIITIEAE